ncbi:MAG TPA: DUF4838 domain-containing protein [Petrimonas sp.]|uniref:DUF4838 domain-containing protein n=1 Tax=Petrimonas sp. TaxID=2023866 RepID=UPI001775B2F8|nr:DUF4838 domain-containing protein [Petrimonas sp.]
MMKYLIYYNYILVMLCLAFCISCTENKSKTLYEPARGPFSKIVQSGQPLSQIIIPVKPTYLEEFAATELQKYIEKISDAMIPIIKEDEIKKHPYSIILGVTKKSEEVGSQPNETETGRDGFEIKSLKNELIIRGRNDLGTLFGVYELLERYFDVRWFMPGEEYFPRNNTLKIGQINLIYKPSFTFRWVGSGEWALHQRMNCFVNAEGQDIGINWKWHFHTFRRLIPPELYYEKHPEYFALVDGKRTVTDSRSSGNQLCTSNPDVVREVAKNLIDTLNVEPDIEIITLAPNDGRGFCECEHCSALDEPGRDWHAKYSNRLAIFNRDVSAIVKEKYPNVLIKVGAYAMYARPPLDKDYKPEENQIIQLCHLYFCHTHPLGSNMCKSGDTYEVSPEYQPNQEFEKILDQWLDLSPHLFIYEYYSIDGMGRANLPWPMMHNIRTDIPYYRNKGVEGFYTQQSDNLFYRLGLNYYVAAKLCWNADLNVESLIDDYFDKFYGKAAYPMKEFYMSMEESMLEWNKCCSYGLQGVTPIGIDLFTPELIEKMEKFLITAEKLSVDDEIIIRRVAMARRVYNETVESLIKLGHL